MNITILGSGTSQGVPLIGCRCEVCRSIDFRDQRLRVSVLINIGNKNIVIDSGPDFRQQMLRERVDFLDALIFTHEHKDHTAGMDDIRAFNFRRYGVEIKSNTDIFKMPLYARKNVIEQLKNEFSYAFAAVKYPGSPQIDINIIENTPFFIDDVKITPVEVLHYNLPIFGYRIGDFTYITDANYISENEKEKIRGTKVLVINALQKSDHVSHYTLSQALEVIEDIKPDIAYLTHISHNMGLHAEVEKELPINVRLAFDGLKFEI